VRQLAERLRYEYLKDSRQSRTTFRITAREK
jgi:hypothetical protein